MTRKDTILIAVVINAGLLAILFTTAVIYDTDPVMDPSEFTPPLVENKPSPSEDQSTLIAAISPSDEVDHVLKYYTSPLSQPMEVQSSSEAFRGESTASQSNSAQNENASDSLASSSQPQFIEIKVKQGDRLEKIARTNKTTVSAIKRVNHLESERLSIGQVLKIPVKPKVVAPLNENEENLVTKKEEAKQASSSSSSSENEPVYYVIQKGDNPWKVAKQFNVKYDEILRLNQMSEEKARNLKIGDRIRVK